MTMEIGGRDFEVSLPMSSERVALVWQAVRAAWPNAILCETNDIEEGPLFGVEPPTGTWIHVHVDFHNFTEERAVGVTDDVAVGLTSILVRDDGIAFVIGPEGSESERLMQAVVAALGPEAVSREIGA